MDLLSNRTASAALALSAGALAPHALAQDVVVQAQEIDLRLAGPEALSARGGAGGASWLFGPEGVNGGGTGGPGLIQFHVANTADVLLAPGTTLDDLSAPAAKVLDLLF